MNCCTECFHDEQIKEMITANNQLGECSFCKTQNIPIYPVDKPTDLSDLISEVISMYEESSDGECLSHLLLNDWHIFNRTLSSSESLLEAIYCAINGNQKDLNVIRAKIPLRTVEEYGIFGGHTWADFSKAIKNKNRFHLGYFKMDQFALFLTYATKKYPKGTVLFRARISSSSQGFVANELGAPPSDKRRAGRINPEGIGVLYLTTDERTALCEVRASAFDFVSVGAFRLLKDISIIDISALSDISPALCAFGLDPLAANINIFADISKEIAKPLRRNDSPLEYLPTQFIAEFIKGKCYAGVEYASTMGTGGSNIAIFDESLFECNSVHNVEIRKLEYSYDELLPAN